MRRAVGRRVAAAGSQFCVRRRPGAAWPLHQTQPTSQAAQREFQFLSKKIIKEGKPNEQRDIKPASVKVYPFGLTVLNKAGEEIISPPPSNLWWRDTDQSKWSVVKNGPERGKRTYALHQMPANPEVENAYIRESDGFLVIEWKDDFLLGDTHVQEVPPFFINVWRRLKGPYQLMVKRILWDKDIMDEEIQTVPGWRYVQETGRVADTTSMAHAVTGREVADDQEADRLKKAGKLDKWEINIQRSWETDAHLELERTGIVKIDTGGLLKKWRDTVHGRDASTRRQAPLAPSENALDDLVRKYPEPAEFLTKLLDFMGIRQSVNLPQFDRVEEDKWTGQPRPFASLSETRASPGVALHTAHAYAADQPGLGLAFCLHNDVQEGGGALTFSDGFRALTDLELQEPDIFLDLMQVRVMHSGYGLHYQAPIFRMYHEVLEWIRWDPLRRALPYREDGCNPSDEESMLTAENSLMMRRRAEVGFAKRACAPEHVYELDMKPGDMVLWNNKRVLHGAKAFTLLPGADAQRNILYAWLPWQDHRRILDGATRAHKPSVPVQMGFSSYELGKDSRSQRAGTLGLPLALLEQLPGFRAKRELQERDRCVEVMARAGMPYQDALALVRSIRDWNAHKGEYKGKEIPHEKPPYPMTPEQLGRTGTD